MELFITFASQLKIGLFVRPCVLASCQKRTHEFSTLDKVN